MIPPHQIGQKRFERCRLGKLARLLSATLIFQLLLHSTLSNFALAAGPTSPSGALPAPTDALFKPEGNCIRSFIYRNRTYPVDSSRKADGEGLRFLFKHVGQTEEMLNDYQARLKASRIPGFVGTFGLALAVGGSLYSATIPTPLGNRDTRTAFLFAGVLLAVGGYGYGQYVLKRKEKVLEKAVENYNDAVPEPERIRVDLTPVSTGTGGEIKTVVPF